MIKRLVLWIYCLPIGEAVLLALSASALLFWLRGRYRSRLWWTPAMAVLAVCWAAVVTAYTLFGRTESSSGLSLMPLQTYATVFSGGQRELLRSAFMNVLMFYPGGLLLLSLRPRWKIPILLAVLLIMSVAIEVLQYRYSLGFAETDDVLHNTLGAWLGMFALRQYQKNYEKTGDA